MLYRNIYFETPDKPLYGTYTLPHQSHSYLDPPLDWMDFNLDLPKLTYRGSSGHTLISEIYLSLGRTATHHLWTSNNILASIPASHLVFTGQVRSGHLSKLAITVTGQMTADFKKP